LSIRQPEIRNCLTGTKNIGPVISQPSCITHKLKLKPGMENNFQQL
ncbi:12739_t:CDS:1, partial [Cetraspora pellucida]